mmetsp:Transcript_23486/g.53028  ORF Transcript_23486/g.53028 Transcript_23486/m.53028 type:complete len:868 (+) Transcript_23486:25-2628(+)
MSRDPKFLTSVGQEAISKTHRAFYTDLYEPTELVCDLLGRVVQRCPSKKAAQGLYDFRGHQTVIDSDIYSLKPLIAAQKPPDVRSVKLRKLEVAERTQAVFCVPDFLTTDTKLDPTFHVSWSVTFEAKYGVNETIAGSERVSFEVVASRLPAVVGRAMAEVNRAGVRAVNLEFTCQQMAFRFAQPPKASQVCPMDQVPDKCEYFASEVVVGARLFGVLRPSQQEEANLEARSKKKPKKKPKKPVKGAPEEPEDLGINLFDWEVKRSGGEAVPDDGFDREEVTLSRLIECCTSWMDEVRLSPMTWIILGIKSRRLDELFRFVGLLAAEDLADPQPGLTPRTALSASSVVSSRLGPEFRPICGRLTVRSSYSDVSGPQVALATRFVEGAGAALGLGESAPARIKVLAVIPGLGTEIMNPQPVDDNLARHLDLHENDPIPSIEQPIRWCHVDFVILPGTSPMQPTPAENLVALDGALRDQASIIHQGPFSEFSAQASIVATGSRRGCSLTCRQGHLVIPQCLDDLASGHQETVETLHWKLCQMCDAERMFVVYTCGVCGDEGLLCGRCAVGHSAFCPQGHLVRPEPCKKEERFIKCEICQDQGRRVKIECPFGRHYHRRLCGDCSAREYMPLFASALEVPQGPTLGAAVRLFLRAPFARFAANPAQFKDQFCAEICEHTAIRKTQIALEAFREEGEDQLSCGAYLLRGEGAAGAGISPLQILSNFRHSVVERRFESGLLGAIFAVGEAHELLIVESRDSSASKARPSTAPALPGGAKVLVSPRPNSENFATKVTPRRGHDGARVTTARAVWGAPPVAVEGTLATVLIQQTVTQADLNAAEEVLEDRSIQHPPRKMEPVKPKKSASKIRIR